MMAKDGKLKKPNIGPHSGSATNPLQSFDTAYKYVQANPEKDYYTTGNATPFIAMATTATRRGASEGQPVIRFLSGGRESARAYKCCWGYRTNCLRTHIDCYTKAVK